MAFASKNKDSLTRLTRARKELSQQKGLSQPVLPSSIMGSPAWELRVASVSQLPQALVFQLSQKGGGPLPAFAPGQSISLLLRHGPCCKRHPFVLCGTAEQARRGSYYVTLLRREATRAEILQDHANSNSPLLATSPWGGFSYQPVRDGRKVLAVAEEEGLLSFISLARTLAAQESDLQLTLAVCGRTPRDLLYREELDALAEDCPRLRVLWLSEERSPDCLAGPLSYTQLEELLNQAPSSLLVSGSWVFCRHLAHLLKLAEEKGLPLPPLQRQTLPPPRQPWLLPDYPQAAKDMVFRLSLNQWGETRIIEARAWETVLAALERAGVEAPARCLGGDCGFCRAKLLAGRVYLPPDCDGRPEADLEQGYIHPCCCYPLSHLELELNGDPVLSSSLSVDF